LIDPHVEADPVDADEPADVVGRDASRQDEPADHPLRDPRTLGGLNRRGAASFGPLDATTRRTAAFRW